MPPTSARKNKKGMRRFACLEGTIGAFRLLISRLIFRRGEIAGDLIFSDRVHDDLIQALRNIELKRLVDVAVLLLSVLVVCQNVESEFVVFGVGLIQLHAD